MFNTILQVGDTCDALARTDPAVESYLPHMTVAAGVFAALALALLGRAYRQRRRRLRLRLLTGRRTLWRQELEALSRQLAELEVGDLQASRPAAEDGLNGIHASLLDRQAHLQNCEDLANLQLQKIATLNHRLIHEEVAPTEPESETDGAIESRGEHRERVQAKLLEKIRDIQHPQRPPGSQGT